MKLAAIAMLLVAASVSAGVTVTKSPASYELHSMPDNKMVPGPWPTSAELCETIGTDMAKAGKLADFACVTRTPFKVAVTCADEKAPHIYLEQVEIDGGKYWEMPAYDWPKRSDTEYDERAWLYVHNPAWPAGYPNCWVRGWEDPTLWRANPKAEPGKVFMERIEPGMTAEDVELPPDESYTCWSNDTECVPPVSPA